ncbi:MAG: hypothetical protein IKX33_08405 [Prevotella sp.]|nr:hypothetical protein [Prevotella sp.]
MNRTHFNFALFLVLLFIISIATFSCNKETNNYKENSIKYIKPAEKTSNNRTRRKWIEYKKMLYDFTDTLPYNDCYIIIEKDSLFYYKEGKLQEVRTMVREEHSDYAFTFKENADDHILFSSDYNSFKLSRYNYDGLKEYFILDKEYVENSE